VKHWSGSSPALFQNAPNVSLSVHNGFTRFGGITRGAPL